MDYVEDWKKKNPYNSRSWWTGPNAIFTVPATERTNRASWEHDAAYNKYEEPYFHSVPEDQKWIQDVNPLDPVAALGTLVFSAKSLLPAAKLKPKITVRIRGGTDDQKSYPPGDLRPQHQTASRTDSARAYDKMKTIPDYAIDDYRSMKETQWRGAAIQRSFLNGPGKRNMPKRKFGRFKRRGAPKSSRKRSRLSIKRGGQRRKSMFRRRVSRALRRISRRMNRLPLLEKRTFEFQTKGGSAGLNNVWMYRVVDNMAATEAAGVVSNANTGWNYNFPLFNAILQCYGANPVVGDSYVFTERVMKTMFQSPTNTPTFCEVYLLKPKYRSVVNPWANPLQNPLRVLDQGTTNGTVYNPGGSDGYVYHASDSGTSALDHYQGYGTSEILFNPFKDRNNYKDSFKITAKYKFILGPMSSKIITLKSKKKWRLRATDFLKSDSTLGVGNNIVAADMVPVNTSSRIMIIRWHGFNQIGTDTTANNYLLLNSGMSADPIIMRRWFKFTMYKQDTAAQVNGTSVVTSYTTAANADLLSYSAFNAGVRPGGTVS